MHVILQDIQQILNYENFFLKNVSKNESVPVNSSFYKMHNSPKVSDCTKEDFIIKLTL